MFNLGMSEMILIGIIALIFIGPKQLPEIARTLGRMLNELKRATEDISSSITNPNTFERDKNYEEERQRVFENNRRNAAKLEIAKSSSDETSTVPEKTELTVNSDSTVSSHSTENIDSPLIPASNEVKHHE